MKRYFSVIFRPFKEDFPYFLSLWMLVSFADIFYWTSFHDVKLALIKAMYGFIATYFVVLFTCLFDGKGKRSLQIAFWCLGIINLLTDTFIHHSFHTDISDDMIAIIYGTNLAETKEFLTMYLPPLMLVVLACGITISIGVYLIVNKFKAVYNKPFVKYALLLVLLSGTGLILTHPWTYGRTIYLNKIGMLLSYKKPADFKDKRYLTDAFRETENGPQHVVLIMGESMSKSHCSLYGYEKKTTPRLDSLNQAGIVYKYNRVTSPAAITVESFKYMMTLFNHSSKDEFWQYPFLLDIMKGAGFYTIWISNQSSAGLADNVVARFAELADTTIWVGKKGMGQLKVDLDEDVIPVIDSMRPKNNDCPCFWFIHLMGSHEAFHTRYPSSFDYFKQDDYSDKPQKDRWLWSSYDNSVRYTDFVVTEIMRRFKNDNAIVIYLPDHGMDIYESDPTYAGHAKPNDSQSFNAATRIPLVLFPTDCYLSLHPDKLGIIKSSVDEPFNTEDITCKIMDLADITLGNP